MTRGRDARGQKASTEGVGLLHQDSAQSSSRLATRNQNDQFSEIEGAAAGRWRRRFEHLGCGALQCVVFSTEEDSIQTTCSLLAADLTWQSRSDRSLTGGGPRLSLPPQPEA
jgi:hypothetical protein